MSKPFLTADRERFIDELAALLAPWGMQPAFARLYGYLLLCPAPVSLDEIAEDLGMAKSSASVVARLLERHRLARRHGERGTRRVRYSSSNFHSGVIAAQAALLGDVARLIDARSGSVANGKTLERLRQLSGFYLSMQDAMEKRIKQLAVEMNDASGRRRRK
jgi:HTH-type transcriptional regulator, osmoprotectant uptake regulator